MALGFCDVSTYTPRSTSPDSRISIGRVGGDGGRGGVGVPRNTAAGIGLGYASGVVSQASAELVASRLAELLRRRPEAARALALKRVELVPRVWYNPDLRSRWFFVPAVLAMVLMVMTMVLSSMGVVREKEIGTMEQLIVTPIRSWQLIVGKLLPWSEDEMRGAQRLLTRSKDEMRSHRRRPPRRRQDGPARRCRKIPWTPGSIHASSGV